MDTQGMTPEEEVRALQTRVEEQTLEIEQLRAQVEDLRQAQMSPYPANLQGSQKRTWSEFGEERNERCNYLHCEVIRPALDLVQDALVLFRTDRVNMGYNHLLETERTLEDYGFEDEDEDEEDEEAAEDDSERGDLENVATRVANLNDAIEQESNSDEDDMEL